MPAGAAPTTFSFSTSISNGLDKGNLQDETRNIIGIDHDTVCAGVVGTAIRNSTSCAGRRAAACGRAGRHNETV